MTDLAVFCSGFGSNFQAIADAIRRKKLKRVRLALMVCDRPGAYAVRRAHRAGIPVFVLSPRFFKTRQAYEKVVVRVLKNQKVDLIALAGFMRILTPYFIRSYKNRIVNIHPSLLPAFKGAHAIRDAFKARVKETGVTVHLVTAKVDSGRVLLQKKVKVSKKDTLASLEKKIHRVEHHLYPAALQKLARA